MWFIHKLKNMRKLQRRTDTTLATLGLHNLKWNGELPPSYSIVVFESETNEHLSKIVVTVDFFGGRIAYAEYAGRLDYSQFTEGERLDEDERRYIARACPALMTEIRRLETVDRETAYVS